MARGEGARRLADVGTGEEVLAYEKQRANYSFRPDPEGRYYVMLGALAAHSIEQSTYDGVTLRLLIHLARTTDSTGLIQSTQTELAQKLNTTQPTISRSLKKLMKDHHVYKRGRAWFVNPETAFFGKSDQHLEAVARTPDEHRMLAVVKPLRPEAS